MGANTEADEKSAYNASWDGPTQRISKEILQTMQVGAAPTQRMILHFY